MTSVEPASRRPGVSSSWLLALLLLIAAPERVAATEPPEVWLVTYGPGEIYWQRFGHNAIWIRDEDLGLDHTFNFGFFDFEQEDFFLRFLQGRMLYFSAAQPAAVEFSQYIDENRSIRAQRLALTDEQALGLTDFLVEQVQPANRDYLYDYYLDNCSTRVRDALDRALGGRLREATANAAAGQNFRDHTRRLTQATFWLYLGLELGLGSPVDRPISRWDEFFIPGELADGVAQLTLPGDSAARPLVLEDVLIHDARTVPPPGEPRRTWPRYLLSALALLAVTALLAQLRRSRQTLPGRLARLWLVVAGGTGCALVFFWVATDHAVAAANMNLLVFNPLWLAGALCARCARPVAALILLSGAAAIAALFLPPHQYAADVLAAFLPLNVAAAAVLRRPRRPDHRIARLA